MEATCLEYIIDAEYLEETYVEHEVSELIFLTHSCMYYVVLDILAYELKEASKNALGETADVEEVLI